MGSADEDTMPSSYLARDDYVSVVGRGRRSNAEHVEVQMRVVNLICTL